MLQKDERHILKQRLSVTFYKMPVKLILGIAYYA